MMTRKQFFKKKGFVIFLTEIPVFVLFTLITFNYSFDSVERICIILVISLLLYKHRLDEEYLDYNLEELEKEIKNLKS